MLGIGKKQVDGRELIDKSIGVFNKVAEELEQGIALCDEEECGLDEQIRVLSEEKASLRSRKIKAEKVRNNILQIIV